ncbi:homologous-pairing protein 2 homolog [Periplaneta americana]|uniref:homologous-pairing protein 2 homolog n=1 Tax=Periplaneta americana TaxID=6978 RepID=UPI0037E70771
MGPTEIILKYLRDQNRPYSANDIFMNLHKEVGKTSVQKCLDQLVEQGAVIEKVYGKQKVYVIKQEDTNNESDLKQELKNLDSKLVDISGKLATAEQELKNCELQLRELQSTPTTVEAKTQLTSLEDRVQKLKDKLEDLSKNTVKVSVEERENIQKNCENNLKFWRKRKRLCLDIVDSILEGYPKDKKTLLGEVGIETDEDAGVSMTL